MKSNLIGCLLLLTTFGCSNENSCKQEKLDSQTKQLLAVLNESSFVLHDTPIAELRTMFPAPPSSKNPGVQKIENQTIPNSTVGFRIYTPNRPGPYSTFVFIHGGGWALGSLDDYDPFCQEICAQSGCLLISIDYGLAPEHPFPQPLDDCTLAARWIDAHVQELGGISGKIAIGGDSAGANLAAAVTLRSAENQGPNFVHQILVCPITNCNFDTLSYFEFGEGYMLTREDMKFFWDTYLQNPSEASNPYASPLQAINLAGLPSASFLISDFDPLRDEGLAYAFRLAAAEVPTALRHFNTIHGFYRFPDLTVSQEAVSYISNQLKAVFARP